MSFAQPANVPLPPTLGRHQTDPIAVGYVFPAILEGPRLFTKVTDNLMDFCFRCRADHG